MGLVALDLYNRSILARLEPLVMAALANAATRLGNADGDAACLRWFGANDDATKRRVAGRIRRMRSLINVNSIGVGSMNAGGVGWRCCDGTQTPMRWR